MRCGRLKSASNNVVIKHHYYWRIEVLKAVDIHVWCCLHVSQESKKKVAAKKKRFSGMILGGILLTDTLSMAAAYWLESRLFITGQLFFREWTDMWHLNLSHQALSNVSLEAPRMHGAPADFRSPAEVGAHEAQQPQRARLSASLSHLLKLPLILHVSSPTFRDTKLVGD